MPQPPGQRSAGGCGAGARGRDRHPRPLRSRQRAALGRWARGGEAGAREAACAASSSRITTTRPRGLAFLARKEAPGLEVFGGIDLNLPVGGMNPAAVEHMTQVAGGWGRVVWMSTFDAENQVRYSKENRPFVSVSRNGAAAAGNEGRHRGDRQAQARARDRARVARRKGLMLLREGRQQGVQHMVVTHAMNAPVLMDVPQMQEAATRRRVHRVRRRLAGVRRRRGAEWIALPTRSARSASQFCILSSDLGQKANALPPDGFAAFLLAMRDRGFTEQERRPDVETEPGATARASE